MSFLDVPGLNPGTVAEQAADPESPLGMVLSATYSPVGGGRPVGKGELVLNFADYRDGSGDDTAALQALITGAGTTGLPALTVLVPGTLVISGTINITQRAFTLIGLGRGNPTISASKSTVIRWNGPAGIPMFKVADSRYITVKDMAVVGNTTNRPSEAFYFDSAGGTSGTNSQIKFENVTIGSYPWASPATPSGTPSLDYGVRFGGLNANNDQFTLQDVVISNCGIAGLAMPNTQSIWGECQNVFFDTCGVGIKTSSNHSAYNVSFNACGTDIMVDSTARVDVFGWGTEGSAEIFNISGGGSLQVIGAVWTIQTAMQGKANFASAPLLAANLSLRNVRMNYQITPKPKLYVRGTYAVDPYKVSVKDCLGLDLTTMDVWGYGAAGKTFVEINTQGVIINTTITQKNLSTYIAPSVKVANYTALDGESAPIITNGAAVTITLPDPTTVTAGRTRFTVKNINAAASTVVSAGTAKTIDGAASVSLTQWQKAMFMSDGTQWLIL